MLVAQLVGQTSVSNGSNSVEYKIISGAVGNQDGTISAVAGQDALKGTVSIVVGQIIQTTDKPMIAQAIPSVSPGKGAQYFHKTECFCFEQQYLEPGESISIPLKFVIDPDLPADISSLALGYTLFDITKDQMTKQASN